MSRTDSAISLVGLNSIIGRTLVVRGSVAAWWHALIIRRFAFKATSWPLELLVSPKPLAASPQ